MQNPSPADQLDQALPSKLDQETINKLTSILPDQMKIGKRLITFIGENPKSPSGYVSNNCAVSNISDSAQYVNKRIYEHGYFIGCEKPRRIIKNKFGENSNQFLWSVYKVA